MMLIQVFSQYLQLAQEGKVDFLSCPQHKEEEAVFPLSHTMENDKVFLYCPACGYKNFPGLDLYNTIVAEITPLLNEPKKEEDPELNFDILAVDPFNSYWSE